MIEALDKLPDISFVEGKTLDQIQEEMVSDYQAKYAELTGSEAELSRVDPISLMMYATSVQFYQLYLYLDRAGKLNLLKYTYGAFLDHVAARCGISREPAKPAVTTIRFTLSAAQGSPVPIPAGTRVSNGTVYFATDSYAEVAAGSTYVDVLATCQTAGIAGNGILTGSLSTLVDPIAYVGSVSNTETSSGGTDTEDDETLKKRIYLAPSSYSVAGPASAYEYWVLTFNSSISDVQVITTDDAEVDISFIMDDGSIPGSAMITALTNYLSDGKKRPLTDMVNVHAPTAAAFNVNVTYYINSSDSSQAALIQAAVADAVDEYITWQQSKIGRDINPDKLTVMMLNAGAKRVAITYPARTVTAETEIPQLGTKTVTYGGLEND